MQAAYFDSSALLCVLLQEAKAEVAATLWNQFTRRVSSILLNAECWIGMRRHFSRSGVSPEKAWLEERADFLSGALATVQIAPVDGRILEILRERAELADCKTLDALHIATALHFSAKSDEGLVVVSLDERMRQTARKLKLEVLPD
jgi:predicted nucleic acid-binding protein